MPASITRIDTRNNDGARSEMFDTLVAAGVSAHVRLQGAVVVQIAGSATAITARVEHATRDPSTSEANWAPAHDDPFSGDLSAGMAPLPFTEPATGWWRVRVSAIAGGDCKVSIIGETA